MAIALAVASVPAGIVGVFLIQGGERISGMAPGGEHSHAAHRCGHLYSPVPPKRGTGNPVWRAGYLTGVFQPWRSARGLRSGHDHLRTVCSGVLTGRRRPGSPFAVGAAILGAAVLELPKA
jgi:hypothetical protein